MREKVRDKERLEHILSAIQLLLDGKDYYTLNQIKAEPLIYFGFVKNLEIIGEATYMLSKEFRAEHSEINWDEMIKMRHVLVHGYYSIREQDLWDTINNDLPKLKPEIEKLYNKLGSQE